MKEQSSKIKNKIIAGLIIVLLVILAVICTITGFRKYISSQNKITKIGFENIGELATQSAYCTEVNVTEAAKELWGIEIPFTQSKYIYSYDFVIKAGFDFGQIQWKEENNKITVTLPEVKILSSAPVDGSFKLFHEQESIFKQVTLEENIASIESMKQQAEEEAIGNGLFENAKTNAEAMLRSFFGSVYDMNEYEIEFIYK